MSMDLRIGIIADDKGAQQEFEKLSQSVDYSAKSVSTLRNELKKYNVVLAQGQNYLGHLAVGSKEYNDALTSMKLGTLEFTGVVNKYLNALDRQTLSYGTNAESLKAYKKEVSSLQKEVQALIAGGVGGGSWSGELQNLNALTERLATSQKKLNDAIKEQNRIKAEEQKKQSLATFNGSVKTANSQNIDYLKAQVLGQTGATAQMEYNALSNELSKTIAIEGVASENTINLANKMKKLEKAMKEASRTPLNERMANLVKSFVSAQVVVWGIRKVFTSVINLIKESAKAASEAEETFNLFITTFENVSSSAVKTANTLASSFGMASSTAQKALGTFGDLVIGYGATDKEALQFGESAAKTALDIISYKNISGDMEQTFQSIASGLAGNVENFRKLGYVITQAEVKTKLQKKGLDRLTGSSLQYAQVQARLEILQEKAYKSQGDMIKTLDSTENITRRLSEATKQYKENLGKNINKIFSPIKKWWLEILEATNKATIAKENYLKTGDGGGIFNPQENSVDYDALKGAIRNESRNHQAGDDIYEYLKKTMLTYNASVETMVSSLKEIFPTKISKAFNPLFEKGEVKQDLIDVLTKAYNENQEKQEKIKLDEETKNAIQEATSKAVSLFDSLSSVSGLNVYGISENTFKNAASVQEVENKTRAILKDIVDNLSTSYDADFLSTETARKTQLSGRKFLTLDEGKESNKNRITALESIFDTLYNNFLLQGRKFTEEQEKQLQSVLDMIDKAEKKQKILDSLEKVFSGLDELSSLFNFSDLLSFLLNLVTQTEAFTKLASIVTDSILPVLNAFLEPLLPLLELLGDLIQTVFLPVFEALYPALKLVAITLTWVIGMLDILVGVIRDSVKWAIGWISKGFLDFVNNIIDALNNLPWIKMDKVDTSWANEWANTDIKGNAIARYKKMQDSIDKIQSYTMSIDKNTEKKDVDLSFLQDMKSRGLIDEAEFESLYREKVGMPSLDRVDYIKGESGYIADYRTTGSNVKISYGDTQIVINGYNKNPEELAKEITKIQIERHRNGNLSYASSY